MSDLYNQQYIRIAEHMMTEEMKQYFPYEAQIKPCVSDMLKNIKTFCKEPQTPRQWHDHYMKESEKYNELSNDYHDKAEYYKAKAKEALKK